MTRRYLVLAFLSALIVSCCNDKPATTREGAGQLAPHPNKVVPPGEGRPIDSPFHPVSLLLSAGENAGAVTIYEFLVPPKSPGSPPHIHTQEDEYFFVISGRLSVLSDSKVIVLDAGGFAALNRGHAHMYWNAGDVPVKVLIATTGGSFEAFFESVAPALAEAKPADSRAAGEVIGKLAAEHGITISMDKMPPEAAPFYTP